MMCVWWQTVQIIKSAWGKGKKLIYKKYQEAYFMAKPKNKDWTIITQKWLDWGQRKVFRDRGVFAGVQGRFHWLELCPCSHLCLGRNEVLWLGCSFWVYSGKQVINYSADR
jgi:hypothetical protein